MITQKDKSNEIIDNVRILRLFETIHVVNAKFKEDEK
jgi:hypothetical protein